MMNLPEEGNARRAPDHDAGKTLVHGVEEAVIGAQKDCAGILVGGYVVAEERVPSLAGS